MEAEKSSFSSREEKVTNALRAQFARNDAQSSLEKTRALSAATKIYSPPGVSVSVNYGVSHYEAHDARDTLALAQQKFKTAILSATTRFWERNDFYRRWYHTKLLETRNEFVTRVMGAYDEAMVRIRNGNITVGTRCTANPNISNATAVANAYQASARTYLSAQLTRSQQYRDTLYAAHLRRLKNERSVGNDAFNSSRAKAAQAFMRDISARALPGLRVEYSIPPTVDRNDRNLADSHEIAAVASAQSRAIRDFNALQNAFSTAHAHDYIGAYGSLLAGFTDTLSNLNTQELLDVIRDSNNPHVSDFVSMSGHRLDLRDRADYQRALGALTAHERGGNSLVSVITSMNDFGNRLASDAQLRQSLIDFALADASVSPFGIQVKDWLDPKKNEADLYDDIFIAIRDIVSRSSDGSGSTSIYDDWVGTSDWSWSCFDGDTLVQMADGTTKAIRYIAAGERVASFIGRNDIIDAEVSSVTNRKVNYALLLNGTLIVTPEHKFLVKSGEYVPIGQLLPGDRIVNARGNLESITSIEKVRGTRTVFNIEIADTHTYIAGGYRVHNIK